MNYTRQTSQVPYHGNNQHKSYNSNKPHNAGEKPSSSHSYSHRSYSVKSHSNKSYGNHDYGSNNHSNKSYKDTSTNDNYIAKSSNNSSYHRAQSSRKPHSKYDDNTSDYNKPTSYHKTDTSFKSQYHSKADNDDIYKSSYQKKPDNNDIYKSGYQKKPDNNDIYKSGYQKKPDNNNIYKSQIPQKSKDSDFTNFTTSSRPKKPYSTKIDDDDDDIPDTISKTQVQPKLRTKSASIPKKIDLTTQEGRKEVADETLKILSSGKYTYIDATGKSVQVDIGTKIFNSRYSATTYKPDYYDHFTLPPKGPMCKIEVRCESTFGAARRLCGLKLHTCALNFASATKPGGGFKNGKKAQEECLSRQSALYETIKYQKEMYQVHLANKYDNVYKDYMIYSPSVPVFRDDRTEQLLGPDEVFYTDVITSAAPWKAKIQEAGGDLSNLDKIISRRCEKIFKCAIDNKVQALVLGAYGCGVFGNKPKDVSRVFKELLIDKDYGKYFKVVEFAITGPHSENFTEFTSTFRSYM